MTIPPLVREVLNAKEHDAIVDARWTFTAGESYSKKEWPLAVARAKDRITALLRSRLP